MAWLRRVYQTYPRGISAIELSIIFGVLMAYLWLVSFWHWGVYRLDLPLPENLSDFFYAVWLKKDGVRAALVIFLIFFVVTSNLVRRYTFGEVGIRFDNILKSGKECLLALIIIIAIAASIFLIFHQHFSLDRYFGNREEHRSFLADVSVAFISGIIQQFILQGIFLVRAIEIFKSRLAAILVSSALFSLIHSPNEMLMVLTFFFGIICSSLFIRNRNIITIGIFHGIAQQIARVFLASYVVTGISYSQTDYYDYKLRVGPLRGDPEYLAQLEHDPKNSVSVDLSEQTSFPVSVTNKSTVRWDSGDADQQIFISYHLLDSKGELVSYDNVLTPFETPVEPGASTTVNLLVSPPPNGGSYYVEVDLVEQLVSGSRKTTWFKRKGSKTILVPLTAR